MTKFQNMDTVLQPVFYELISKTVQQLHISRDKEGFLDLLLNLFRTIQVRKLASAIWVVSALQPDSPDLVHASESVHERQDLP